MNRQAIVSCLILAATLTGCGTGVAGNAPILPAAPRTNAQLKPVAAASNLQMAIQITVAMRSFFPNDNIDVQTVTSCDGGNGTYEFTATVGSRQVQGTYYAKTKQVALNSGSGNMQMAIQITVAMRSFYPNDNIDVDFVSSCTSNGLLGFSAQVGSRRVSGSYDPRTRQVLL